jgi:hypothetical protein
MGEQQRPDAGWEGTPLGNIAAKRAEKEEAPDFTEMKPMELMKLAKTNPRAEEELKLRRIEERKDSDPHEDLGYKKVA